MQRMVCLFILVACLALACKKEPDQTTGSNKVELGNDSVHSYTGTQITLSAVVSGNGLSGITDYGFCWDTIDDPGVSGPHISLGAKPSPGTFTGTATGLIRNTGYFCRSYAATHSGVVFGTTVYQKTANGRPPVVRTIAIDSVTAHTVTCRGEMVDPGDAPVVKRGFCWNHAGNPTLENAIGHSEDDTTGNLFSHTVQGLVKSMTYYIRSYAINDFGTAYEDSVHAITTLAIDKVNVTFTVVITETDAFEPGHDDIYISGEFENQWAEPGSDPAYKMSLVPSTAWQFRITLSLEPGRSYQYKFARVPYGTSSWTYAEWDGEPNRMIAVSGSVTESVAWASCPGVATVSYGGKQYPTVQVQLQCWLKENLNVGDLIHGSQVPQNNAVIEKYCYENLEANCQQFGGLYAWDELMNYSVAQGGRGICPVGWHIPTDEEWVALTGYLFGNPGAGGRMKVRGTTFWSAPNTGASNANNYTALGSGFRRSNGAFLQKYACGYFWSSTSLNSSSHWYRQLTSQTDSLIRDYNYEAGSALSVRCLKDK